MRLVFFANNTSEKMEAHRNKVIFKIHSSTRTWIGAKLICILNQDAITHVVDAAIFLLSVMESDLKNPFILIG